MMDLPALRQALRRMPFQPFSIRLADGRALSIEHPEFVAVGNRHAVVIAPDDSWSVVEPLLIVSLDYEASPKKGSNGDSKKKRHGS